MTKTFIVKYPCKIFLTQLGFKPNRKLNLT